MGKEISATTKRRLCIQGYGKYSDDQLASWRFGIRFAYTLCTLIATVAIALRSIPVLFILAVIAGLGVLLPFHPFDYLYNYGVRNIFGLPAIPPRTAQAKFACGLAAVWLILIIILFVAGFTTIGILFGSVLVAIATLVSFTDICIPSMIYNLLAKAKILL